jgi:hypothetical protein
LIVSIQNQGFAQEEPGQNQPDNMAGAPIKDKYKQENHQKFP